MRGASCCPPAAISLGVPRLCRCRYNVAGAVLWAVLFVGAGYFFGGMPFVQHNFTLVRAAPERAFPPPALAPGAVLLCSLCSTAPPWKTKGLLVGVCENPERAGGDQGCALILRILHSKRGNPGLG